MLTPLILALAAVVVMDLAARIIPDIITLPMLVYACLLAVLHQTTTPVQSILGLVIGGGVPLIIDELGEDALAGSGLAEQQHGLVDGRSLQRLTADEELHAGFVAECQHHPRGAVSGHGPLENEIVDTAEVLRKTRGVIDPAPTSARPEKLRKGSRNPPEKPGPAWPHRCLEWMEPRSISPGSAQGWPKSLHLDRAPGGVLRDRFRFSSSVPSSVRRF
jgi:hypothetical protein